MSDDTLAQVKKYLQGGTKRSSSDVDTMHSIEMHNGKRAKRTIDATRINKDYNQTKVVQGELLRHYENVDWYERSHEFDFDEHMNRV